MGNSPDRTEQRTPFARILSEAFGTRRSMGDLVLSGHSTAISGMEKPSVENALPLAALGMRVMSEATSLIPLLRLASLCKRIALEPKMK